MLYRYLGALFYGTNDMLVLERSYIRRPYPIHFTQLPSIPSEASCSHQASYVLCTETIHSPP